MLEQDSLLVGTDENGNAVGHLPITRVNNVEGIGRLKSAAYSVGDVVYLDTNNAVALKCTTEGTTSDSELDISTASVGDSVADGGVVWSVVKRDLSTEVSANASAITTINNTLPTKANLDALSMPSEDFVSVGITKVNDYYTAPCDGWFHCSAKTTGESPWSTSFRVNGSIRDFQYHPYVHIVYLPLRKGQTITLIEFGGVEFNYARFYYAQSEV